MEAHKFLVAQLGARMHYAVPSIFARADLLERFYTDTYAPRVVRSALSVPSRVFPKALRRWLGRIPTDIPEQRIVSFNGMGLEYYLRRRRATTSTLATEAHLWVGSEFCRRIIDHGLGNANAVYTFNGAGLELLQYARSHGALAVMEQTGAPRFVYESLHERVCSEFVEWAPPPEKNALLSAFCEREERDWDTANLIICGSEFVRDGIRSRGGPVERCRVVPYGIRPPAFVPKREYSHNPIRVLTVGGVQLMKGTPYVLAAARAIKGRAEFRMVGSLNITPYAQQLLSRHLILYGSVPRSEIHQQFAWADIFLLPSICEGSATVCYEALAYGLPVIATPNTGSVVRDGVDGFIVPIRDAEAITDRVERLASDRDLLISMSRNALERASDYTVERYGERLLNALAGAAEPVN